MDRVKEIKDLVKKEIEKLRNLQRENDLETQQFFRFGEGIEKGQEGQRERKTEREPDRK